METINNRSKDQFRYKSIFDLSVKDVDTKSGIVTGYYAAFDNIDSYGDMIIKGAFLKTIAERGPSGTKQIKHLYQHDSWSPIGTVTLLKEDKHGLYFESQFSKTQFAQDILLQYSEGIFNEHSIGYRATREEIVKDDDGNIQYWKLIEIKLWEGSTVTWGANSNTPFTGFKSDKQVDRIAEVEKRMQKCIAAMKIGSLSDETQEQLQIELLKINEAYKSLITDTPPQQRSTCPPNELKALKELSELL